METIAKSSRLDLRLTPAVKDLAARAARAENKKLSEYISDTLYHASARKLSEQQMFTMNDIDFTHFEAALNGEADPNAVERLRDMADKASSFVYDE